MGDKLEVKEAAEMKQMKIAYCVYITFIAFALGSMIGCYLTYTTENAWVSFFWFCLGLFLSSLVMLAYEIVKKQGDEK